MAQSKLGNIVYTWLKNGRPFHLDGEAGQQVFRESPFDGNIIFVSPGKTLNQKTEIRQTLHSQFFFSSSRVSIGKLTVLDKDSLVLSNVVLILRLVSFYGLFVIYLL